MQIKAMAAMLLFAVAVAACWYAFEQPAALAASLVLVYIEHRFSDASAHLVRALKATAENLWLDSLSLRFALEEFFGNAERPPAEIWNRSLKRAVSDLDMARAGDDFKPKDFSETPLGYLYSILMLGVWAVVGAYAGVYAHRNYGGLIFIR